MEKLSQFMKMFRTGKLKQIYHNRFKPTFFYYSTETHFIKANLLLYKKLKKTYKNVTLSDNDGYNLEKVNFTKTPVFVCWFQGISNSPMIIKKCVETIKNAFSEEEYEIVEINSNNIFHYVDFPEYINQKWENGQITNTHFSDLLRLELLTNYGGFWIDATVFSTDGEIPSYINNSSFFVYSNELRGDKTMIAESWFIKAEKCNPILLLTKKYLYLYWKKHNKLCHYFLFHLFFTLSCEKYPDIYSNVPKVSSVNPHMMINYLSKPYNDDTIKYLKEISKFHKLTYKANFSEISSNTLYNFLIRKE